MIRTFLDLIFPPLCLSCREICSTKQFCAACWQLCEFPDPILRCRHCFNELNDKGNLCTSCRKKPQIEAKRVFVFDPQSPAHLLNKEEHFEALASCAYLQWLQLELPDPDFIIPMPNAHLIAGVFGDLLQKPVVRALRSPFIEDLFEEDQEFLLFDIHSSVEEINQAILSLHEYFPKKIHVLSLFPYVDFND